MLTQEQFLEMNKKLKEAEKDDTPFAVVTENEISVVGDANKTETKKHNYIVSFRFPAEMSEYKTPDSKEIEGFILTDIVYNDVFVQPRKDLKILGSIMKVLPWFKNITEDGDLEDKTQEELIDILIHMEDEIIDSLYTVVCGFLDIADEIQQYVRPTSVFNIFAQLIEDYPEAFNEADVFFG